MKHTFKEGDEVEILDTENISSKHWYPGVKPGVKFILSKKDIIDMENASEGNIILNNNKYGVNFYLADFKLISTKEPIYEIY